MLTKKDKELLLEHFVTKTEFDQAIEKLATKEETNKKFDLVMTTLDKVLKEVIAMRQEQTIHYQQHEDINTESKDIKKRIKKLEDHHTTTSP